jgi:hypothetical protein
MKTSATATRKTKTPRRQGLAGDAATAVRLPKSMWGRIDRWARDHGAKTRSEAIRRLAEQALVSDAGRPISSTLGADASDLAGHVIDRLADRSATREEQAKRKRRLIKGPSEFRTARRKART